MYVMHCLYDQKPTVFYQFLQQLDAYIFMRALEDEESPSSRTDLEGCLGYKFVFTKGDGLYEDKYEHFMVVCVEGWG